MYRRTYNPFKWRKIKKLNAKGLVKFMNFSIIIPTWNRSELVDALLESLYKERKRYTLGETEVLVIDSSKDDEKNNIINSCKKYDANYIEGDDSVRKKRNKGIKSAKYDYILFIDSDVTVESGILDEYVNAYKIIKVPKLGGVLGYTEFVGKKTFWWKILEKTPFVNSFSFARNYPFHSWTIGNNVSFKKSVVEEIGMFEENFPFKLGGDDLDMTYRVTKAGYMIGSAPNAVTYHSRKTWNNYKAVHDRAKRWGTMENYIVARHPELYRRVIPKNYIIETLVLICMLLASVVLKDAFPILITIIWIILNWLMGYINDIRKNGFSMPIYYFGAILIGMQYEYYRIKQSIKNHSLGALYKGIIFNRNQIKFGMKDEAKRVNKLIISYSIVFVVAMLIKRFIG